MKRSVPADFDPVYPYDEKKPHLMPPFFSGDGLTNEPMGTLSLNTTNPLKYDKEGQLTVNVGRGLKVNGEGQLQITALPIIIPGSIKVKPPLSTSSTGLCLKMTKPLHVNTSEQLDISLKTPIALENDSIALKHSKPLSVVNNKLTLPIEPPLYQTSTEKLGLKIKAPLHSNQDELTIDADDPLTIKNSKLTLNIGNSMTIDSKHLSIKCSTPLNINSFGLNLNIGEGLTVKDGKLITTSKPPIIPLPPPNKPLQFKEPLYMGHDGKIGVKLGQAMFLNQGAIQLKLGEGLNIFQDGGISVNPGPGLGLYSNKIAIDVGEGMKIYPTNKLDLKAYPQSCFIWRGSEGIDINIDEKSAIKTVKNKLTLETELPIHVNNGKLSLKAGSGLNSDLSIKLGSGLKLGLSNELTLNLDESNGGLYLHNGKLSLSFFNGGGQNLSGLDISDKGIYIKTGKGIELSEGNIHIKCDTKFRFTDEQKLTLTDNVLWTTPNPSLNFNLDPNHQGPDSTITLALSRSNGFVHGIINIQSATPLQTVKQTFIDFKLFFDKSGHLIESISDLKNKIWGFKSGKDSYDPRYIGDFLQFMPNKLAYNGRGRQSELFVEVVPDYFIPEYGAVSLQIILNREIEKYSNYGAVYELHFHWYNLIRINRVYLSNAMFSYIGE